MIRLSSYTHRIMLDFHSSCHVTLVITYDHSILPRILPSHLWYRRLEIIRAIDESSLWGEYCLGYLWWEPQCVTDLLNTDDDDDVHRRQESGCIFSFSKIGNAASSCGMFMYWTKLANECSTTEFTVAWWLGSLFYGADKLRHSITWLKVDRWDLNYVSSAAASSSGNYHLQKMEERCKLLNYPEVTMINNLNNNVFINIIIVTCHS